MKYKLFKIQRKTLFTQLFYRLFPLLASKNPKYKSLYPFHLLTDNDIKNNTNIDPLYSYRNQIYWTPRFFIHKELSQEFIIELKKFKKINDWKKIDQLALTQLILTEATRDTTIDITYNYKVKPSHFSPFHGNIDILMYNSIKEENYLPVVPVIFPQTRKLFDNEYEDFNLPQIVGIGWSLLNDFKAREIQVDHIKAFITNGSDWSLFEIHDNYVKKTKLFQSKSKNNLNQIKLIYEDISHVQNIVGLIRYALSKLILKKILKRICF